tara:strand:- start:1943 stop:2554 length:612 start_codon:yes stop_codon:yes gene_type:complete
LYSLIKYFSDFILAIILFVLLIPIILIIILILKIFTRDSVFFKHKRIGEKGKGFILFKFRTMKENRENILKEHFVKKPQALLEWKSNHKLKNDPRITKIGFFLRELSFDEIPQIYNIIKGDMSFVGPRPIVEKEIEKYGVHFNDYKKCKPGLTGLWQVSGRNNTTYKERVNFDMFYIKNKSFLLDVKILFKTIPTVLSRRGAY